MPLQFFFSDSTVVRNLRRRSTTYPGARAADLGVPLLTVQTHLDALADEEAHPHDDVEHGALALVIQSEVEHH